MQIQSTPASPNFQAKLILGDERIHNFVKSSFLADSKRTFDTLDKFSVIYPDAVVTAGIKNIKNKDYLVVKNGVTGATEKKLLHRTETVDKKDGSIFIDLIQKVMNKKSFWA